MMLSERVQERMAAAGLTQSELARRVGVAQPTIFKMIRGNKTGSRYLHHVARELGTTAAYLMGETDDPDENAPAPLPPPTVQFVTMQVALPTEPALSRMFLGLLQSLEAPNADELAPELAKLLPSGLQTLRGPLRYEVSADRDDVADGSPDQLRERRERQQA